VRKNFSLRVKDGVETNGLRLVRFLPTAENENLKENRYKWVIVMFLCTIMKQSDRARVGWKKVAETEKVAVAKISR
jgi:hypothetical protein